MYKHLDNVERHLKTLLIEKRKRKKKERKTPRYVALMAVALQGYCSFPFLGN